MSSDKCFDSPEFVDYDNDCKDYCMACTICCPFTFLAICAYSSRVLFGGDVKFGDYWDEALPYEIAMDNIGRVCSTCLCYPFHFICCCWTCRRLC